MDKHPTPSSVMILFYYTGLLIGTGSALAWTDKLPKGAYILRPLSKLFLCLFLLQLRVLGMSLGFSQF